MKCACDPTTGIYNHDARGCAGVTVQGWAGIRCRYCGTNLARGRCPVSRRDCGRPR